MLEQNDPRLTHLHIGSSYTSHEWRRCIPRTPYDYFRLGAGIGKNTNITSLYVDIHSTAVKEWFHGLRQNSSIAALELNGYSRDWAPTPIIGGVGQDILNLCRENHMQHLNNLSISTCSIENGGEVLIQNTLRRCIYLRQIRLCEISLTDDQLLPIVEALREYNTLEELLLPGNRIGNAWCQALVALLEDANSNLQYLNLYNNNIDSAGANTIINSLSGNKQLRKLFLHGNHPMFDHSSLMDQNVHDALSQLLCNKSSINNTFLSNHTLQYLPEVDLDLY